MASSGRFDISSSSSSTPVRPLYKRGSHSMDRSSSFRENIENPILSSLPSMSRSSGTTTTTVNVSQGEVTNFFQCLRFDLKSMAAEYKCNRFGDFKRLASAALCAPDDSPSNLLKGKLPFSSSSPENLKRLKVGLRESTIKARERVKIFSDVLSVMNKCFPSIPSRKRTRPDSFYEQQKVDERGKNVIPNPSKRTRTSIVDQRGDVRPNTPARSSGSVEVVRLANNNSNVVIQGEERVLPVVKPIGMKKKRTGMKADDGIGIGIGIRDSNSRVHPRSLLDAGPRSRLNDSHGFRPGAVNVREDFNSGSPSSTPKLHVPARGPRSGTAGIPKLLPHGQTQRAPTVSNGGLDATNKNPGVIRKRALSSTQSSSPPVTQWAERRPQKISRTARRTNLVPVVPVSNDDDDVSTVSEKRRGFAKRFPKQFKSKVDHTLSESDAEISEKSDVSNLVISKRKNKFMAGFAASAKQLKSGRLSVDKPESKSGRPSTRKLTGRKAYMRQKHSVITNATIDFPVTSDDGHGELLAAANAVINPDFALSNPFWKQMEGLFGFVYDADVAYIKQEGSIGSNIIDNCDTDTYSNGSYEPPKSETEECSSEYSMSGTTLCQRLLAALISEEDNNNNDYTWHHGNEDVYEFETDGGGFFSSYRIESPLITGFDDSYKGLVSEPGTMTCSEYEYVNMSINQRLVVEIHSLGLYPSPVPDLVQTDDEDVSIVICRLEQKHHQQVSRKKRLLNKLLKSIEEARELHEKEFQRLSLEKLTRITYHKYTNCKGLNGKMAKQASLDCVKHTLDRCHEFETTGKSCFSDPFFRNMFTSHLNDNNNNNINTQQQKQKQKQLTNFDFDQTTENDNDVWSIKGKKRELYLDDVAKGKRSGKSKIKQKPSPIPVPVPIPIPIPKGIENNECMGMEEEEEDVLDLSHLQLPEFDVGQGGEDIGSWLNIGDEVLQDDDFMGLEIPMDDLTDLNMMV